MAKLFNVKSLLIKTAGVMAVSAVAFLGKTDSYAMNNLANLDSKISQIDEKVASFDTFSSEASYLREWFKAGGYGNHEALNPRKMYSPDGDFIAVCFDIDQTGYIILNTINYDIMEFSFDTRMNTHSDKLIYAGFSSVYEKTGTNRFVSVKTGEAVYFDGTKKAAFDDLDIARKPLSQKVFNLSKKEPVAERNGGNGYYESGSLNKSLVTWKSSYYCQVDCAAILLKYLHDNTSYSFLPSGNTTNTAVQKYLCTNSYLFDMGMNSYKAVNGGLTTKRYVGAQLETVTSTGIKRYLKDKGLSSKWTASSANYSYNTIKSRINENRPVSLGVNGNKQGMSWGSHQVVVHGYLVGYDGGSYLKVNDTFGSNGINLNGSSSYFSNYDMWYIR